MAAALGELPEVMRRAHARVSESGVRARTYGLLDYAAGAEHLGAPHVAVFPVSEQAGPNLAPHADVVDAGGGLTIDGAELAPSPTVQRVEVVIGVVCCVAARRKPDARMLDDADAAPAAPASTALEDLVTAARTRLLGWIPVADWTPLELRRGRLISLADGRAHWQDDYATTVTLVGGGLAPAPGPAVAEVCAADRGGARERIV